MSLSAFRVTTAVASIPLGDGRTRIAYRGQEINIDPVAAGPSALAQLEPLAPLPTVETIEPVSEAEAIEFARAERRSRAQALRWARYRVEKGSATPEDLALLQEE